MSYEQNPDQCLLSTPFSYRRSNPQLLWEFLFLLSPVTVTAKARAPAAQQQQSFFFLAPSAVPHTHRPQKRRSMVFSVCQSHTDGSNTLLSYSGPPPPSYPVHRTDKERTEERKKSCCWPLQHAAPSHRPRCGAACRRHSLPASSDRGKKGGGGRES